MPEPTPLSPAELAQLEHAFATDPNSDAYRPLAEAYLKMGRFMEAMVVCKKGVKAHPDKPDPRVLLASVYAAQNKDRKAIDELEGALQTAPSDPNALRMAAGLLLKAGDNDKGKDYALRAYKANKGDAETKELLEKWKIDVPVEAPPPAPAPPQAVMTAPDAPVLMSAVQANGASPTPTDPMQAVSQQAAQAYSQGKVQVQPQYAQAPQNGTARAPQGLPPGFGQPAQPVRRAPSGARPRPAAPQRPQIDLSQFEESEPSIRTKGGSGGVVTLGFAALAVVALVGYYFYSSHVKKVKAELASALHDAAEELDHDSYASYKKACEDAERALKLDPDSPAAHAYLAYAYSIRWGEHGEGESARSQAQDHLEKGRKLKADSQHLIAAEALYQFFDKNAAKAEGDLEKQVGDLETKNRASALVYQTLGIIEMRNGDLEKAGTHLKKALDLAGGVPRTHAALGDLYRRQGQEILAWTYYDNALRYEKDHADAVLGKSLLVLEAQNPNYKIAEDLIKRVRDADPPPSPRQLAMGYELDGMRLNQTGNAKEGLVQEQKALALDPNNPEIHVLVGRRMLKDGQNQQGLDEIKKAIDLDKNRATFYVELARAQMSMPNGAKDAIASLQKALNTLPGSGKLLSMLGDAYQKAGDTKNAASQYEKAINLDPKAQMPDARLALAELARKDKNFGKAMELYERAATDYGNNTMKVAEVYDDEALLAIDRNDPKDKQLELLKKSNQADPNFANTYIQMARLLATDKSQKATVKACGEQYLKLDPKGPYAEEAKRWAAIK
ncbi:MAG: tetratricopeptide repeat protein [Deltaproteobacteria bacterium]|nr:tetratricopeptide repeat protein [Deltaproteobacteria bacterium]